MIRLLIPFLLFASLQAAVIVDEDFSGFQYNWIASSTVQSATFNSSTLSVDAIGNNWATADLNVNLGSDFIATWDSRVEADDYSLINLYADGIGHLAHGGAQNGYSMWVDINDPIASQLEVQSYQNYTYRPGVGDGDVGLSQDIATNEWMSWELVKSGASIQVSVNGELLHNFTDTLYENSDFYLGLGSAIGVATYDNLLVTTVDAAVPEPNTLSMLWLGTAAFFLRRKAKRV